MKALIIVDVQRDFSEGGSLAVEGGDRVAGDITEYARTHIDDYDGIVTTQDWHIAAGSHFEEWPVHCVAGTDGARLHPSLLVIVDAMFKKGQYSAAYSGFEAMDVNGIYLGEWLATKGITEVDICGIATDYCVKATCLDALKRGFKVKVKQVLCAGVSRDTTMAALKEMDEAGATVV